MRLASFCFLLFVLAGISAAQDMNFAVGPQYLMTSGSPMFARPIATPTLSLDAPLPSLPSLPEVGPPVADQPFVPNPEIQGPVLLPIYYGYPMPSVVELTSTQAASEVPQSIINAGVVGMTNVQSLSERGYGVTLGESALFWKSHKLHASRLYTNADVERLHGG
jgi:hypothetical protein